MLNLFQWRMAKKVRHLSTGNEYEFYAVSKVAGELWISLELKTGAIMGFPASECLPVVRSMSSLTAVEQVEFSHLFLRDRALRGLKYSNTGGCVYYFIEVYGKDVKRPCSSAMLLWLASIGVDVGFFPEGSFVLEV